MTDDLVSVPISALERLLAELRTDEPFTVETRSTGDSCQLSYPGCSGSATVRTSAFWRACPSCARRWENTK